MSFTIKTLLSLTILTLIGVFAAIGGGWLATVYLVLSVSVAAILAYKCSIKKRYFALVACAIFISVFVFPFFYTLKHQGIFSTDLAKEQQRFHEHRIWDWGHIH